MINKFYVYENFDFESPIEKSLNLKFIYNQIIHSYIFVIDESKDGSLNGVSFSSDYKKNESLYFIGAKEIKKIFRKVGNDYPAKAQMIYNEEKEDYDISIG